MTIVEQNPADVGGGLRVADLVAMPHLGLQVVAGASGLERRIEWTHVSELEDPGPWLEGGEMLIVNGFGVPSSDSGQAEYVTRLSEYRVVALVLGERTPPLAKKMLDTADQVGLPLLRIPKETPFVAISHLVANANQHIGQQRLVRHLQILDTLRLRDGTRASARERFSRMEDISGYRLALTSSAGHAALPDWPWVPEQLDVAELAEGSANRIIIDGGYAIPVPVGHRVAAFLIALEQPNREPAGLSALQHIATVAAIDMVDVYREREAGRRSGAEALAELLAGRLTAEEAATRLEREGLDRDDSLILAAFRGVSDAIDDDELHHRLSDNGVKHLMLRQDELYVLMADQPGTLESLASELGATAGVSSPIANCARLALARREALWSLASGGVGGRRVFRFAAQDSFSHWLPADLNALETIVNSTLGPIIDYDAANKTELLKSLAAFFRNQRKVRQTAGELFVHENTLAYRLKRIEAITDRNLDDLQDTSELWFALKALPIVRGRRAEASP